MAEKITVTLTDDLDPGVEATTTIAFGWGRHSYLIDLGPENAHAFEECMEKYVSAARKDDRNTAKSRVRTRPAAPFEETAAIRAWAQASGYPLAERGRIPQAAIDAYRNSLTRNREDSTSENAYRSEE